MNKKIGTKIIIDVMMAVLYVLLMFDFGTGDLFHEIVGIGVAAVFIIHIILNFKPFVAMYKQLKNKKLGFIRTLLFVSDVILPFTMTTVIVTGIMIARTIFTLNLSLSAWMLVFNIHNITACITLYILALHLLFHAKYLIGIFKKGVRNNLGKGIATVSASVLLIFFAYMVSFAYFKKNPLEDVIQTQTNDYYPQTTAQSVDSVGAENTTAALPFDDETDSYITEAETEQQEKTTTVVTTESHAPEVSLEDYLSKLICTGCHNRCPLSSPRCGKGIAQAEAAEQQYNSEYGIS